MNGGNVMTHVPATLKLLTIGPSSRNRRQRPATRFLRCTPGSYPAFKRTPTLNRPAGSLSGRTTTYAWTAPALPAAQQSRPAHRAAGQTAAEVRNSGPSARPPTAGPASDPCLAPFTGVGPGLCAGKSTYSGTPTPSPSRARRHQVRCGAVPSPAYFPPRRSPPPTWPFVCSTPEPRPVGQAPSVATTSRSAAFFARHPSNPGRASLSPTPRLMPRTRPAGT